MTPYYEHAGIVIYNCDCREVLPALEQVDLVISDSPYRNVLSESWDRAWASDAEFLDWLDGILGSCLDLMADNGTLYAFASSRLAAEVEVRIKKRANVIASCVWDKGRERLGCAGSGVDVTSLRTFWSSASERCVVAEHHGSDSIARGDAGYVAKCDELRGFVFEPIRSYLDSERKAAGVTPRECNAALGNQMAGHYFTRSQWALPTEANYERLRKLFNRTGAEYLRTEYEDLRAEYEDLRAEYEDLRRPFNLTASHQWGDVWSWPVERTDRHHPAQKPIAMIRQLIEISSRPGATVLSPFMGSGTDLRAAKDLGRKAIGCDVSEAYCEIAAKRLAQETLFGITP